MKLRFVTLRRLVVVGFVGSAVLALCMFIRTLEQTDSKTWTRIHQGGIFVNPYPDTVDPPTQCDYAFVETAHPLRLRIDGEGVFCGWDTENTVLRTTACFVIMASCLVGGNFVVVGGRQGHIALVQVMVTVAVPLIFSALCLDGHSLNKSMQFCSRGMHTVVFRTVERPSFPRACNYQVYIFTVVLDSAMFVAWSIVAALFWRYAGERTRVEYDII